MEGGKAPKKSRLVYDRLSGQAWPHGHWGAPASEEMGSRLRSTSGQGCARQTVDRNEWSVGTPEATEPGQRLPESFRASRGGPSAPHFLSGARSLCCVASPSIAGRQATLCPLQAPASVTRTGHTPEKNRVVSWSLGPPGLQKAFAKIILHFRAHYAF